jgi:hypothetical protein
MNTHGIDVEYLIRMKRGHFSDKQVAARLGVPVERVTEVWNEFEKQIKQFQATGTVDMINQFNIALHQYQLLGDSFKALAAGMENRVAKDKLMEFVSEEQADKLLENFIIINPFKLQDPHHLLEEAMEAMKQH